MKYTTIGNTLVEAIQIDSEQVADLIAFIHDKNAIIHFVNRRIFLIMNTVEGTIVAKDGDWIIRYPNGVVSSCSDEIFFKTFKVIN